MRGHLVRLTTPMIGGLLAMMAFNLTGTWFVAQLGAPELAAMSFTFPVVMVLIGLGIGLMAGTSSVIARAIGQGDAAAAILAYLWVCLWRRRMVLDTGRDAVPQRPEGGR